MSSQFWRYHGAPDSVSTVPCLASADVVFVNRWIDKMRQPRLKFGSVIGRGLFRTKIILDRASEISLLKVNLSDDRSAMICVSAFHILYPQYVLHIHTHVHAH